MRAAALRAQSSFASISSDARCGIVSHTRINPSRIDGVNPSASGGATITAAPYKQSNPSIAAALGAVNRTIETPERVTENGIHDTQRRLFGPHERQRNAGIDLKGATALLTSKNRSQTPIMYSSGARRHSGHHERHAWERRKRVRGGYGPANEQTSFTNTHKV